MSVHDEGVSAGPKRVLIVGAGAREHALAWKLAGERAVERVLVTPGNPGMRRTAGIEIRQPGDGLEGIASLAISEEIDLVVIGPESVLVAGIADRLRAHGLPVFGPDAAAARIEGSKSFCREVAQEAGIPMAEGRAFDSAARAIEYAHALGGAVAIKADGLASGKGVWVCESRDEIASAVGRAWALPIFGRERRRVVVERALRGPEASVIAICDATTALALPSARDHKRLRDGDTGPNTGGMGAYSPVEDLADAEVAAIVERFHVPVLLALGQRGTPFRGALFAGLMLTNDGPQLLEFNARFGDPEAQVTMPRLAVPLGPLLLAAAQDRLAEVAAELGIAGRLVPSHDAAAVGVVLVVPGYPEQPELGSPVEGVDRAESAGGLVFCAGVRDEEGALVTSGGRVATVVGTGASVVDAAGRAYAAADGIEFRGKQMRRDIGRVAVAA